jgi:hypothetical protein
MRKKAIEKFSSKKCPRDSNTTSLFAPLSHTTTMRAFAIYICYKSPFVYHKSFIFFFLSAAFHSVPVCTLPDNVKYISNNSGAAAAADSEYSNENKIDNSSVGIYARALIFLMGWDEIKMSEK